MAETPLDYAAIGLMAGIEIHQQLKSARKLFCRCMADMTTRTPDFTVKRTFRPVLGEMGVFDEAMLLEFKKRNVIIYEGYNDINCTYELDDTPPFECDPVALATALELARVLGMNVVDELKVCRKNYLDGSVTAGFQRTMIVAKDGGYTLASGKQIGVEILCLEEDSARRVTEGEGTVTFRLDRLGIPLVEIATAPDIANPDEAREAAARLGLLLRSTGKVRRGLGVTRQDLNVSIADGARVEIKGVQKLDWIPLLVEHEARRQLALVGIKREMERKGLQKEALAKTLEKIHPIDLSSDLASCGVKFIKAGVQKGQKLHGVKVPFMAGLLGIEVQPDRRLGTEISDRVKVLVGLTGIIHSDEQLDKYGFTGKDVEAIRTRLAVGEDDAFILVLGSEEKLARAFPVVKERVILALDGVPPETRRAQENGNTDFLRGLHGGSRLYPDTDSRAIPLDRKQVDALIVPPKPWEFVETTSKKLKLDPARVEQLVLDGFQAIFTRIVDGMNVQPSIVLNTLLDTLTVLSREGLDVEVLSDDHLVAVFDALARGTISKEALEDVLKLLCTSPASNIEDVAKQLDLSAMGVDALRAIIDGVLQANAAMIAEKGDKAFQPLMGDVMKAARGKIDGKIVSQELRKALGKVLQG